MPRLTQLVIVRVHSDPRLSVSRVPTMLCYMFLFYALSYAGCVHVCSGVSLSGALSDLSEAGVGGPLLCSHNTWPQLCRHTTFSICLLSVYELMAKEEFGTCFVESQINYFFFFLIVDNKSNVDQTPVLQLCSHSSCILKVSSAAILLFGSEFNPSQEVRTHWGGKDSSYLPHSPKGHSLTSEGKEKEWSNSASPCRSLNATPLPSHFTIMILLFTIIRRWRCE